MKYDRAYEAAESKFKKKEKPVEPWRAAAENDALLRSDTAKTARLEARRLNRGVAESATAAETARVFSGKKEATAASPASAATTEPKGDSTQSHPGKTSRTP
jgi:hypothetical protein